MVNRWKGVSICIDDQDNRTETVKVEWAEIFASETTEPSTQDAEQLGKAAGAAGPCRLSAVWDRGPELDPLDPGHRISHQEPFFPPLSRPFEKSHGTCS